ncbi:MAG: M1 family aminopeptidase [Saprospiraceae bacterium]
MKKILSFLPLFMLSLQLFAQPDFHQFAGCHNAQLSALLNRPPLSPEEVLLMENSNRRSDSFDILNYFIHLDVTQVAQKSISAHTQVSFRTKMDQLQSITLDLKKLTVDSVLFEGQKVYYNYDTSITLVFFGRALNTGFDGLVDVYYHGIPHKDPVWGGVYFVPNYIYNLGIGLSTTPPNFGKVWFPCFDNFVERTTYDYEVTSQSPGRAYCVGHFVKEDSLDNGKIRRTYRMDNQIPTYLSSFAVSDYVVDRSLTTSLANPDLPIDLIARPADLAMMRSQFAKIPDALDAFEFWFGPYRFERIGFVATTVGAMEHPTNTAYPISTVTAGSLTDNELLYSHEFGHQWWGNLTTLDDARDMWIKEGNAEYSSHLFLEYAYGHRRFLSKVRDNLSDIIFNAHVNDGDYLPLSPMPYEHTYGTHTYRKGAAMIHNLRGYLGDSLYRSVCHTIFDSLTGKSMNAYQYRDFINRNSPVPVTNYFDDYIFNRGYTGFYVDSFLPSPILSRNIYFLKVNQKLHHADHLCHDVPLVVSAYDEHFNRIEKKIQVDGAETWVEVEFPIAFQPVFFLLNDDQQLNYAALQDNGYFNSTGSLALVGSGMTPSITQIGDTAFINIVHHLVGPSEGSRSKNVLRISPTHFWQVSAIAKSNLKLAGRVDYNGSSESGLDYEILKAGEDSVILVYRRDFTEPWREYRPSTKIKVTPNDRRGFIRLDEMIPGEYALAYGYSSTVQTSNPELSDISVYPNPACDYIVCVMPDQDLYKYEVYNSAGTMITHGQSENQEQTMRIPLPQMPEGEYYLVISGQHCHGVAEQKLVIAH